MPDLLARFSLINLCDILILAVLIYYFVLFLKKDIASRLLLILLVFFVTLLISRFSRLTATAWLLDSLFSSTLIILAIVFQTDIRRAFLAMGQRRIEPHVRDEEAEMIEELIKATNEMAEKRIGALIVIVRHLPIDHLLEIGTQIEAKVTSELLNSIFLPYSPIHDGAVIINRGKITMAGCLLPLSRNPDISKSFGTRHRAALGLSELVDALVMVVSEETGKISMVHDGKINYDLDAVETRRILRRALDVKRSSKPPASGDR
jgi:diadenylate cyclase